MKNTMNDIIIRFGAPRMTGGDRLRQQTLDLKKALQQGKILDYIRTPKPKEYTDILITEFLGLKPETLSPADQKIQRLLNILYQINGKEPPLYTRFPRREHPLIIDLTTIAREDCAAHYISDQHKIEFNQIEQVKNDWVLLRTLAHEIKHAQQWFNDKGLNHYQGHQIGFLQEAQARACSERVIFAINPKHPYCANYATFIALKQMALSMGGNKADPQKLEADCVIDYLFKFFNDKKFKPTYEFYKDQYDQCIPIRKDDISLTSIPSSFGLDSASEQDILEDLKAWVPRKARTPENKALQAIENNDVKAFSKLLSQRDADGNFSIGEHQLSNYIMRVADQENASLFSTLLSSRKLKPDDFNAALVSILSFSDDLTPEIVEGRKKMFDALVEQKDSHGHKVISTGDIKDVLEINLSDMVEPTSLSQELVDHAQKYLKNPHTRLSEAQHPTPKRTKSSKPISKRRTGPERL